jgi:hypothetical protein
MINSRPKKMSLLLDNPAKPTFDSLRRLAVHGLARAYSDFYAAII